ncbi:MAG: NAD(P)/FAD-dependent oxidoreductase, partial [Pirellulaceae bacterium]
MSRGITSIGCVADNDYLLKGRGTPEVTYNEELANCPGLTPRLMNATRLGELKTAKEFSYKTKQSAGDGWVLVGDAYGFIDPVYSSGVYFALEMGVRAGDAVVTGFEKNDLSGQQLGSWCESFNTGAQWVRKLVTAFYTKDFSIGRFMKEYPEHRGCLTDVLIGRIFSDQAEKMFADMDVSIQRAKSEAM